jgi:hypothetical protein
MTNKPEFWLAFKALVQIRDKLATQFQARFFAFNAFYFGFNDKAMVMKNVLSGIASAEDIYSDSVYGLDSISKLYHWV